MISETWAWQRICQGRIKNFYWCSMFINTKLSGDDTWVKTGVKLECQCSLYSPWASDKVHPEVLRLPPGLTVWGGGASHSHQGSVCKGLRWKPCNGRAPVVRLHWCLLEVGSDHWPPHCPPLAYCDEPQSEMPRSNRSQSKTIPLIKNSLSCPSMLKEMVIF